MSDITNRRGLPQALIKAMANDPYDKGASDFTATSLIKPARIAELEKCHAHEITEDAEDGLYRLYGQLVHGLLERANEDDLVEKRYFHTFSVGGKDYLVSAQVDTLTLSTGILRDFKFTTSWGFKPGKPAKPEWVAQLNIQRYLMKLNGEERVQSLEIVGLLRDWQIREARFNRDYPQAPVATLSIPVWSDAQTDAFIKMRIAAHVDAARELPECSPEEFWERKPSWAVIKKGGKKAIKGGVQLTLEAATEVMNKNPGTEIQVRPGERGRCESYCAVSRFCSQYQDTLNANAKRNEESA